MLLPIKHLKEGKMQEYFTREKLQEIISRAQLESETLTNPQWKAAYENLRDAASLVDTFMKRSQIK